MAMMDLLKGIGQDLDQRWRELSPKISETSQSGDLNRFTVTKEIVDYMMTNTASGLEHLCQGMFIL
jgi:predicted YcjX-like family ATPase